MLKRVQLFQWNFYSWYVNIKKSKMELNLSFRAEGKKMKKMLIENL